MYLAARDMYPAVCGAHQSPGCPNFTSPWLGRSRSRCQAGLSCPPAARVPCLPQSISTPLAIAHHTRAGEYHYSPALVWQASAVVFRTRSTAHNLKAKPHSPLLKFDLEFDHGAERVQDLAIGLSSLSREKARSPRSLAVSMTNGMPNAHPGRAMALTSASREGPNDWTATLENAPEPLGKGHRRRRPSQKVRDMLPEGPATLPATTQEHIHIMLRAALLSPHSKLLPAASWRPPQSRRPSPTHMIGGGRVADVLAILTFRALSALPLGGWRGNDCRGEGVDDREDVPNFLADGRPRVRTKATPLQRAVGSGSIVKCGNAVCGVSGVLCRKSTIKLDVECPPRGRI
ncbi:hypothetical protein JB92DRAFT_2838365 [Gautieria morchelliformis]|nr:hypothetical protein JB92DRAFT_2838365 [Gautieria morchelliformis]